MDAARKASAREHLRQFLLLAATLASLRGNYDRATRYRDEAEQLGPQTRQTPSRTDVPSGGTVSVALPILGELLWYGGRLRWEPTQAEDAC